jgi:hypothetical protein
MISEIQLSWVEDASSVETHDCVALKVLEAVRTGGRKLRGKIEIVRQVVQTELRLHGNYKRANECAKNKNPTVF